MAVRGISESEDKRIWKFEQREGIHHLRRKERYPAIFISYFFLKQQKTTEAKTVQRLTEMSLKTHILCVLGVKCNRPFWSYFLSHSGQSNSRADRTRTAHLRTHCVKRGEGRRQTSFVNKFIYVIKCKLLSALRH